MKGRIKDFFSRDRKTLYMIFSIVLISIFSLTIVYAALSVTLNISGNAQVVASTWDIHLDNVKVTSDSVSDSIPTISSDGKTATFSTTLNMPGDFYEFTIDVVNDGSIDAMIDGITKTPTLTTEQAKYLNYIIEYQNGESINTKQLVSKNSYVRLKVRVEFRKDVTASDLPTTSETLNLAFTVNYVQSDGSGSTITNNGMKVVNVVSGDGTKTSDEVCIGEECFYVMYSDETTVTMLAKYNLYVGGDYNNEKEVYTVYGEEATGKQDSTMTAYHYEDDDVCKGIVAFSNSHYWESYTQQFPSYIYNSNSNIYKYIENYKKYIENFGITLKEARVINYEELKDLGCQPSKGCTYEWAFSTSYWSGEAVGDMGEIYVVYSTYYYKGLMDFTYGTMYAGVRPVITIDRSLL